MRLRLSKQENVRGKERIPRGFQNGSPWDTQCLRPPPGPAEPGHLPRSQKCCDCRPRAGWTGAPCTAWAAGLPEVGARTSTRARGCSWQ